MIRPIARSSALGRVCKPQLSSRVFARTYAEEAKASDKIKLSLNLPHQSIYTSSEVLQVNIAAATGDMGILANHVPTVESLRPGLLEVIESNSAESKKWFVSSGFASVHPSNQLTINAVEAYPIDQFSPEAVKAGLAEAQRVAKGNGSEAEKAEAALEVEVYEAIQHGLKP